jgi:uncharacterized surface protein with fasciclin (FAS1) repeats
VTILSGTGPFTVFAPTNAALNTELAPGIASVSAANLTKVLQYHVVSEYSSCYFNRRSNCHYVKHSNVYSSISRRIKDARNRIATIFATDVQCSNGVIHVLNDKVLLPLLKDKILLIMKAPRSGAFFMNN